MSIMKMPFGNTDGRDIPLFTLTNKNGMSVSVTTYGASVVSINVPDKNGNMLDVALGFDDVSGYAGSDSCQGAVPGRFANRIKGGKFTLDGVCYQLATNDKGDSLHGGKVGFGKKVWDVLYTADGDEPSLSLIYKSPDGEENYPGTLQANVVYTVTDKNELEINYFAKTNKKTVLNLTNHTYFNLNGYGSGNILDHKMQIFAQYFTVTDKNQIPTGEIRSVKGTPFDFLHAKEIGRDYFSDDEQMRIADGFDHNFITGKDKVMKYVARAEGDKSGIILEVYSDQPALQFYTANGLDDKNGKKGLPLGKTDGFCLETHHTPDTPNLKGFPSAELCPEELYHYKTIFRFSR